MEKYKAEVHRGKTIELTTGSYENLSTVLTVLMVEQRRKTIRKLIVTKEKEK
jgi:hypothetical protein